MAKPLPNILDGGLATELEYMGHNLQDDALWSARLLHTDEQALRNAHTRFIECGSDFITTASYQASVDGFMKCLDVDSSAAYDLIANSVRLARDARDNYKRVTDFSGRCEVQVLASIGPYGACLHDSSEYTGDYISTVSEEELISWHRPRFQSLLSANPDAFIIETIPCLKEALIVMKLLRESPNTSAFIAFSCKDERRLNHGELFSDSYKQVVENDSNRQLVSVGINCSKPEYVSHLLGSAGSLPTSRPVPFVVYPNSGELWSPHQHRWLNKTDVKPVASYVKDWADLNATYIGGCCRVYSNDIRDIREVFYPS